MLRRIFWNKITFFAIVTGTLGFVIGILLKDFPLIKFEPSLKLYEVLNLILTFTIAISIPFLVKKGIDDKRGSKSFIIDEVKSALKNADKIRALIQECYYKKTIERKDKDLLIEYFNDLEIQIGSIEEQLSISFPRVSEKLAKNLKEIYFNYDSFVTGDTLMTEHYSVIDNEFFRLYKGHHSKMETGLKNAVHKVNCL